MKKESANIILVPPSITGHSSIWCCAYHCCIGEKEPDYDSEFWCDHDEDCHGHIDDLADEPTYEDGFVWSCCEKIGSGRPCVRSRHKPDLWEPVRKKLRY